MTKGNKKIEKGGGGVEGPLVMRIRERNLTQILLLYFRKIIVVTTQLKVTLL